MDSIFLLVSYNWKSGSSTGDSSHKMFGLCPKSAVVPKVTVEGL